MTALPVPEGYGAWRDRLIEAAAHYRCSLWSIGDLLNEGERKYGETYAQAADDTGLSKQTLMNCKWVSARFEPSRRREILTFSAHAEVARLDPEHQDKLLDLAIAHGWTSKEMREQVREIKRIAIGKTVDTVVSAAPEQEDAGGPVFDATDAGRDSRGMGPDGDDIPAETALSDDLRRVLARMEAEGFNDIFLLDAAIMRLTKIRKSLVSDGARAESSASAGRAAEQSPATNSDSDGPSIPPEKPADQGAGGGLSQSIPPGQPSAPEPFDDGIPEYLRRAPS